MVKLSPKTEASVLFLVAMLSMPMFSNPGTFDNSEKGAFAQPFVQIVKHRDLVIDLENDIQTNAQLTIPAVGNGPFPGATRAPPLPPRPGGGRCAGPGRAGAA